MRESPEQKIYDLVQKVYGADNALAITVRIKGLIEIYKDRHSAGIFEATPLSEKDTMLLVYGDSFREPGIPPLKTLKTFLDTYLAGMVNSVHILPFFPYTSDDGFSVVDYRKIDPALGSWDDVSALSETYHVMYDAVINHISKESDWFKQFLTEPQEKADWFIVPGKDFDFTSVVRPRTSPLLTPFKTDDGEKLVWTTFSDDQVDLNYENPEVLVEVLDVLLFYASQGAAYIRLDAIAYLWKESGTPCIHMPQTHNIIKLMRLVLGESRFNTRLITETNVPHRDNISYFGNIDPASGVGDEAHLVYQFPLAPLVLYTFIFGTSGRILDWIDTLQPEQLFFNFIASHDGIGMMPAKGLLSQTEMAVIVNLVLLHGGAASYKSNPDGTKEVYELNTTLYAALNDPIDPVQGRDVSRFLAAQAILLSLAGVPGIYYHSLFGSANDLQAVKATQHNRSINRHKFELHQLESKLSDKESRTNKLFEGMKQLLAIRVSQPAFDPHARQKTIHLDDRVFGLLRENPHRGSPVLVLINVSSEPFTLQIDLKEYGLEDVSNALDLLGGAHFQLEAGRVQIAFSPYQQYWIELV